MKEQVLTTMQIFHHQNLTSFLQGQKLLEASLLKISICWTALMSMGDQMPQNSIPRTFKVGLAEIERFLQDWKQNLSNYYFWHSFVNAYSLWTRARALYKPLKFDAPHFVYSFA